MIMGTLTDGYGNSIEWERGDRLPELADAELDVLHAFRRKKEMTLREASEMFEDVFDDSRAELYFLLALGLIEEVSSMWQLFSLTKSGQWVLSQSRVPKSATAYE